MSARAVKEKAAKLVAAGQFERAEVLLRQALTQAPRDVATWLRHAEVLKRLSRNPDAVASYRLAARILDEEGHHPRAVAALKLALSLVPDDVDLIADIIRSEMRARRQGSDVRALFPLSSPSQLLATAASSESGLFQSSGSTAEEVPQLALPMATPVRSAPVEAPATLRAENAAARADAWVPEPTAPDVPRAGSFAAPPQPLPPPERDAEAGSSPVPSDALPTAPGSPQPLASSTAGAPAPLASGDARSSAEPLLDAASSLTSQLAGALSESSPTGMTSQSPGSPGESDAASSPTAGTSQLASAEAMTEQATPLDADSSQPDDLPLPPPSAPVRFEVESSTQWPQVRRLSDTRIAVQAAEGARWVVLEAASAISVRFAVELEVPEDAEWLE